MIQDRLKAIYAGKGYRVDDAPGMPSVKTIWHGERRLYTGLGVSDADLGLFEKLSSVWQPPSIFGIGNGFGWSTVAMRLLWPHAALCVLDAEIEGTENEEGTDITEELLTCYGGGRVFIGKSPLDVGVARDYAYPERMPPFGLVFIDGFHSNEQLLIDYQAVKPHLADEHVVLMHDVGFCRMHDAWTDISREYPEACSALLDTPTGMGVLWTPGVDMKGVL